MLSNLVICTVVLLSGSVLAKTRKEWQSMVDKRNMQGHKYSWKAKLADDIPYEDDEALKKMAGTRLEHVNLGGEQEIPRNGRLLQTNTVDPIVLPTFYNLVEKFPKCWSIGYIRNQGACGSCWAVAAAASISDRFCIQSPTSAQRSYSYQDPLECCTRCGFASRGGCNGGYLTGAFYFATFNGDVMGENSGNMTNCKPYYFTYNSYGYAVAPACRTTCRNNTSLASSTLYTNDKRKIRSYSSYYSASKDSNATMVNIMMEAIFRRGSIIASMTVYRDFYSYTSGVYNYVPSLSNTLLGGHAVRVIGWGALSDTLSYWIVANSWGTYWGQKGFFWIRKGTNECGFESYVAEANPY